MDVTPVITVSAVAISTPQVTCHPRFGASVQARSAVSPRMDRNVGGFDRTARLVTGPLLLFIGILSFVGPVELGQWGSLGVIAAGTLLVAGAILTGTGVTQKCPANEIAGLDTTE